MGRPRGITHCPFLSASNVVHRQRQKRSNRSKLLLRNLFAKISRSPSTRNWQSFTGSHVKLDECSYLFTCLESDVCLMLSRNHIFSSLGCFFSLFFYTGSQEVWTPTFMSI